MLWRMYDVNEKKVENQLYFMPFCLQLLEGAPARGLVLPFLLHAS